MISKNTATDIAFAYREIERAEEILEKVKEAIARRGSGDIRDAFGRPVDGLQLGVPSGDGSSRLFNLPWTLAKPIIEAHILAQRSLISALTEKAKAEMTQRAAP